MPLSPQGKKIAGFFVGSDMTVYLEGLILDGSATYENDATVQMTAFTDTSGTTVSGFTTVTMSYVASSDGNYKGTLPAAVTAVLTPGSEYRLTITATAASGEKLVERLQGTALYAGA